MSTREFQRTASNAGIIGVTSLVGAGVGFILQLLVAYYFGASNETDAFFMAQSTSEMLGKLLMGGSITAVFIPLFVERLAKGKIQEAWDVGFNIINIMVIAYLVLIVILWIFARQFVHIIAPGFVGETYETTVSLLRFLLPSFLFLFLVEFATSMLHSFKQFTLPASLRIIAPLVSIISIVLFVHPLRIYALAVGVVVGSLIQCIILWIGLSRLGMRYKLRIRITDPAIVSLARLVYPFIFSILVTQGAGIVYRMLVSGLAEGSLSSLKFAEKITQLLTIVFLNSVTMVIYPLLSEKAAKKDWKGIEETITHALQLIVFITLPIITFVAILRQPIVSFLFERGSFTAADTTATSIALLYLVLGLTTTGISSVFGHAVLAIQKTKAAVAITIASQIVAISLFMFLVPRMGMAGLALASSLVPIASGVLYFSYLTKRIHGLGRIFMHWMYGKTIILAAISSVIVWYIATNMPTIAQQHWLDSLLHIIVPALCGYASYFLTAHLWHIEQMKELSEIITNKFIKHSSL